MKRHWPILLVSSCLLCLYLDSCKSSESSSAPKPAAIIRITSDQNPILLEYDWRAELWYMRPTITVSETNGVGATINTAKVEFVWQNVGGYEVASVGGGRLNAFSSHSYHLEIGTIYEYDAVRFTVIGTDDNGHNVNTSRDVPVHYVGAQAGKLNHPNSHF